jgi:hypothetical protein
MSNKLALCLIRICNQSNTDKFGLVQYLLRVFGMYRVQIWTETPVSLIGHFHVIYSFFHRVSQCGVSLEHCIGDVTVRISGTLVAVSLRKVTEASNTALHSPNICTMRDCMNSQYDSFTSCKYLLYREPELCL